MDVSLHEDVAELRTNPWIGWLERHGRWVLTAVLVVLAVWYLGAYLANDVRPSPSHVYPRGWWGWADQGEYLKSIRAFATGQGAPSDFLYPPLYALLNAPFWLVSHDHPTAVPDLIYFLIFSGVLLAVGRRFYGWALPCLVYAALLAAAPILTMLQWVIPWTTSLEVALLSGMIALFARAERQAQSFALVSRADWLCFAVFFLVYGAMVPTRPLDIAVWFPFALVFTLKTAIATFKAARSPALDLIKPAGAETALATFTVARSPVFDLIKAAALAGVCGLVFPVLFIVFNTMVFSAPLGTYISAVSSNGYIWTELWEKTFSIFWNSGALYGEGGEALFQRFGFFLPVFAICLVTAVVESDIRRWIVLIAFIHFAFYLPYGDLLPNGFFRYYNLHYFKWAYPWLTVIAVGQIYIWLMKPRRRWIGVAALAASAAIALVGLNLDLQSVNPQPVVDQRDPVTRVIHIHAPVRRDVHFVDIEGLQGGFGDFYFGDHKLNIDGVPAAPRSFRLIPMGTGARLVILKPHQVSDLDLTPMAPIAIGSGNGHSVLGSVALLAGCRFRACTAPIAVPWDRGQVAFDFRDGGETHGVALGDWSGGEPWGRWTKTADAHLVFTLPPVSAPITLTTVVGPLLGAGRMVQVFELKLNGCRVASHTFNTGDRVSIRGLVQPHCLKPDGGAVIEFQTDRAPTPKQLMINDDARNLGVSVVSLVISQGDAR